MARTRWERKLENRLYQCGFQREELCAPQRKVHRAQQEGSESTTPRSNGQEGVN